MRSSSENPEEHRGPRENDDPTVFNWSPSGVVTSMWVALSIMLGVLGFFVFGLAYVLIGASPAGDAIEFSPQLVAGLSVVVLAGHQLLHAGTARLLGFQPRIELDVVQLIFPVMYVRYDGQHFSRARFIVVALSPLVLLSVIGLLTMAIEPRGAVLIIPLAINAGQSMRDLWVTWIVWQQPVGSLVEPHGSDLRIIRTR